MRYTRENRYVSVLTVHVRDAQSLMDMLRYDRCCPYTEADARKLTRMIDGLSRQEDHVLQFLRYASNDRPATVDRWKSFGCTVLDERSPQDVPLSCEAAMRMVQS